jgi:hypothetical protein
MHDIGYSPCTFGVNLGYRFKSAINKMTPSIFGGTLVMEGSKVSIAVEGAATNKYLLIKKRIM